LAIPHTISNLVDRVQRGAPTLRFALALLFLIAYLAIASPATDWNAAEQQLGRKIVSLTGNGPVALRFENRCSLGRRDSEIIENGMRDVLQRMGVRLADQASVEINISLSENVTSYVWVAQIDRQNLESEVALVSMPRSASSNLAPDSVPLVLNKIPLWTQAESILDIAVLQEGAASSRIAVLSPTSVSLYRGQAGGWQSEKTLEITHGQPWPRDLRGRVIPGSEHLLDVYLPGVFCTTEAPPNTLALSCRDVNVPWPLISPTLSSARSASNALSGTASAIGAMNAFFATSRNFFTGELTRPIGKITTPGKFYSAAAIHSMNSELWLFSSLDGRIHLADGQTDQILPLQWGSDLTAVHTGCGAEWQVLASNTGGDSVRAYEFPDRNAVAVSAAVGLAGPLAALWTEAKGNSAIAVSRNQMTGSYEAFRLAVACNH
jgi:hypothetical protein